MKRVFAVFFLLTACATVPPPTPQPSGPAWDVVPGNVLDALCARLQMDAIATGAPVAIVSTTRSLATPQSMQALTVTARGRTSGQRVAEAVAGLNRSLPIVTEGTSCTWRPIAVANLAQHRDEMLVELSAPAPHPFVGSEAGLFARVSVGGDASSWYWITLVPYGDRWRVALVSVLVH